MNDYSPYLTAVARWGLTAAAAYLATHGVLKDGQDAQFINVGLSVVLGGGALLWSLWQKNRTAAHLKQASAAPAGAANKGVPL